MATASVFADIAPLYMGPSEERMRCDEVLMGMSVQVMDREGDFYLARTEYGTEGYLSAAALLTDVETAGAWRKYKKKVVLAPYIDVQKAPAAASQTLVSVPRGGFVVALSQPDSAGWQRVGLPNGSAGYTRASYLGKTIADWAAVPQDEMRWNLVESALSYNGTAYRAGGRTIRGIDGIGLVCMSYLLNGVVIGRENFVKPGYALHVVPRERMDEGDIIYFSSTAGLYMGDGKVVLVSEAPGTEGVMVASLNPRDDDYRPDLAGGIAAIGSLF